jgi:VCBS repeat-containing protein
LLPANFDNLLAAVAGSGWSVERAKLLSEALPDLEPNGTSRKNQEQALRDFLALYALTRTDDVANNGSWEELLPTNEKVRKALFGDGSKSGGLIAEVLIGGTGSNQNPYVNIHKVLQKLEIEKATSKDHHNHFHIVLRAPKLQAIDLPPQNLLADGVAEDIQATTSEELLSAAQGLLGAMQAQLALAPDQGEVTMFVMDVPPDVPAMYAPVVIAQASATQLDTSPAAAGSATAERTIGVCQLIENPPVPAMTAANVAAPAMAAWSYLTSVEKVKLPEGLAETAKTTLLDGAKHGVLVQEGGGYYRYDPTPGYYSTDRATVLVEMGNYKVKVVIHIKVLAPTEGNDYENKQLCPNGELWKISLNPEDPAAPIYTLTSSSQWSSAVASYASVSYSLANSNVNFADLPGGAVGQATGQSTTLDTTAGGHGWYVDPTPLDNTDDYLPTSNPNVWQAKAGSDAAGKMDLLSVLLHEYGHALGLDHSHESGDFMAATLQPGQRRLPSAEELQLMSELVAQLKGGTSTGDQSPTNPAVPSLPLGALLLGRLALGRRPEDAVFDGSQALFAAHPTLQGGGLQNLQDWATRGQVSLASGGGATLEEGTASQTRLNQVFTINERDRFLSFTLAGTALDDVHGGPDDAFEVALLEADTGRSLIGALSLSHTDALLNLQANGTETAAANVTRVTNPDGSRTYRVDLAGVPAGTAVNLSFDLIGFGKTGSQVTVRDVRVSGLPQLHDDAATLPEDSTLAFDPFAQVDNAALLALGSQVVEAPAHGSVSVNADGTFVYTPQANYFGTDSFSYRLNDGPLESNLATVNVTVTAVNDAPVVADVRIQPRCSSRAAATAK